MFGKQKKPPEPGDVTGLGRAAQEGESGQSKARDQQENVQGVGNTLGRHTLDL
jgi:hypothetical protein